jgi:peroxiredoxin family protein/TusA-related sulfurtransferase
VREPAETELGTIPGATLIPLGQLRDRLGEIDKDREIVAVCQVGLRGYLAERILRQKGYRVSNLSGGYLTWKYFHPAPFAPAPKQAVCASGACTLNAFGSELLDVRALACPGPVVRLKKRFDEMAAGETVRLQAQLSFEPDLRNWIASTGNELVGIEKKTAHLEAVLRKAAPAKSLVTKPECGDHEAAIVLFSNDLDKAMAALIIACGMAAAGTKVGIFFTFWGLSVLRKAPLTQQKKGLVQRMFGWMLPQGAEKLTLSKMNMGGMGTMMMKRAMAAQNVTSLPDLLRQARELGVRFVACEMAMGVMGITREELIAVDEIAGVASFVEMAKHSTNTLFI